MITRKHLVAILISLCVGDILYLFVVGAYHIPSESMQDTLLPGDFTICSKLAFVFGEIQQGDVVVFFYPLNHDKQFVKRCVAIEGQKVEIKDKIVFVDNQPFLSTGKVIHEDARVLPRFVSNRDNFGPVLVPRDSIFVLGDNRDNSNDSRKFGFVGKDLVVGKSEIVYWSIEPFKRLEDESYSVFIYKWVMTLPSRIRWERIGKTL